MSRGGLLTRLCTGADRRRLAWRGRVILVAVACLLGQASTLAHRALVQHAVCAEHGESVHVAAAGPASPAVPSAREASLRAALVDEGDQHEHCAAADSRASIPRLTPDAASEQVHSRSVALLATEAGLRVAVPPYLIAPKTSPPRHAS